MKSVLSAVVGVIALSLPFHSARAFADPVPIGEALKVSVSPELVISGGTVTVTLKNVSTDRWFLSGGCLFPEVKVGACDGDAVHGQLCTAILQLIEPGASISQTWDTTDGKGNPVPPGEYHMPIRVQTYGGRQAELCARTNVILTSSALDAGGIPLACGIDYYGDVGHGSGFVGPELWPTAEPVIGSEAFGLHVQGGLGASTAFILVGAEKAQLRSSIGTLAIDPTAPFVIVPIVLGGEPNVPGAGVLDLAAPIPNDVDLAGRSVHLQVLVTDPHASGGYSHSAGLSITICG